MSAPKYAVYLPHYGPFGDPFLLADLAVLAEESGWDGVFLWDHIVHAPLTGDATVDAWLTLGLIAERTSSITIGPMITPLPRRRPWKVAREAVTLDVISGGRLVLGTGLGDLEDYVTFSEPRRGSERVEKLMEGIELLRLLWSGNAVSYDGKWFQVDDIAMQPTPVRGTVPIWMAGAHTNPNALARAAQVDGVAAIRYPWDLDRMMSPEELAEIVSVVSGFRGGDMDGYDVIAIGRSEAGAAGVAHVDPFVEVGMTWWWETLHQDKEDLDGVRARIAAGPPKA
ncbi:MAG: LLM class flavin-dependent oxidoreductase [Solirubrobacteraceae bacterium]|nr:LLM class flavin-dependent oxidoreductase [Solirubrobacteraceae bacterium]